MSDVKNSARLSNKSNLCECVVGFLSAHHRPSSDRKRLAELFLAATSVRQCRRQEFAIREGQSTAPVDDEPTHSHRGQRVPFRFRRVQKAKAQSNDRSRSRRSRTCVRSSSMAFPRASEGDMQVNVAPTSLT